MAEAFKNFDVPTLQSAHKGPLRTIVQHHSDVGKVIAGLLYNWFRRVLRAKYEIDEAQHM